MQTNHEFSGRHIGPRTSDVQVMLKELGFSNLEEMASKVIPKNIRSQKGFDLGPGLSEFEMLQKAKSILSKNKITRNYIGLGFHDTITPTVIQRNILENPVWYTAYTPYQAEIAQGRMESLLNFQTMVTDLTAMEISNASLLDEGTAAAEAMAMAANLVKNNAIDFIVDENLHPHVIEVLHTRSEPLGLKMHVVNVDTYQISTPLFAAIVAYPGTDGKVQIRKELADRMHTQGGMLIVDVDLMSLTLLKPPGEWGADIVVGNSQRFGVPLGFGGPHAAFLATKDTHKRLMPGRLVGVSQDAQGKKALRLALQTREQHIRREKATSNICTAQVLLANMAAMYAVYHGPQGLKAIAYRIHTYAHALAEALKKHGVKVAPQAFFDTLKIENVNVAQVRQTAESLGINLRYLNDRTITLSLHEKTNLKDLKDLASCFGLKADFTHVLGQGYQSISADLVRTSSYLTHPVFNNHHSETELLRYIHHLQSKDLTLTHSMIPLGSCTMKLNATTELTPVSWPEVNSLHPFAPLNQTQGMLEMIHDLEKQLCEITGFAAVSLQPNAGSQGEFAGLLVIRKYHQSRGDHHRNICLIPSSAHGTNPASAVMCGMQVVVVACDDAGNVDVADLKAKAELHKNNLAALMVTYPSTHGVFEESITEICQIIHDHGGQVYMDGANLNALVALCRPGEFGPDVSHMNLHKTFSIPHGGGGPGVGPIGVAAHLKNFLPTHSLVKEAGPKDGISATTSAPWGSASILPISWTYITMMGELGLKQATLISILSANYIAQKLNPYYPVLYKGKEGLVAHECIIDLRHLKKSADVDVTDVAKRLMDYGFHAPTMSWPVAGTLMIEPTESESKAELDRFIEAMVAIRKEIQAVEDKKMDPVDNPLKNAPHTMYVATATEWKHPYSREQAIFPLPWVKANKFWPAVGRVDNAFGDRNVVCSCPPLEDYE
ncbi:MAG: aminomethyl-transferring glycine dehydrogenase [Pseudobdellovibrionaceae bacterium]